MLVWKRLRSLYRTLFAKETEDRELDRELESYLEMLVDEKIQAGMSRRAAMREARLETGGVEQVKIRVRERRLGAGLDWLLQDIRYALRKLRRKPGFAAAALLILALGMGANTALFSTVHAVLLRALPYPEADRLVVGLNTINGEVVGPSSRLDYFDYRERSESFSQVAALTSFVQEHTATGGDEAELVAVGHVTWNLFSTLGVDPLLGRHFLPEEEKQGDSSSILISHGYWQHRFGGAADAVGTRLSLDGQPLTIVGVMPRGFRFWFDTDVWRLVDVSGPFDKRRDSHSHWLVARLKPGRTLEQAQGEVDSIAQALAELYPESNSRKTLALADLQTFLVRDVRRGLLLLVGTTVLVLLIACSNVAGLLLARGEGRIPELALRAALGAPRMRLLRQLLLESVILTLLAGVLSVLVVVVLHRLLLGLLEVGELGVVPPALSVATLLVSLVVSLITGLLVGLMPALKLSALALAQQVRGSTRATETFHSNRLRSGLVVMQVALSVALLVGSGLLIRSLAHLSRVELGFDQENLLTGEVLIQAADYATAEERELFFSSLLEDVEALPGVETATLVNKLPIRSLRQDWGVWPAEDEKPSVEEAFSAMARWVSPGYFQTLGIPILAGRDVAATDGPDSPHVVVVSESVIERFYPGRDPIGRMMSVAGWRECRIVGVVEDARINSLRIAPDAAIYMASAQMGPTRLQIAVRTAGDPELLIQPLAELLRNKDRNVILADPRPMSSFVDESLQSFRTVILGLGLFAGLALALVAIGLYGLLAFHVGRRRGEFGIRLALGATSWDLFRMVLGRGLALVVAGLVAGLALAYPGTLALRQLLYETARLDPGTYLAASFFLLAVAGLACYLPARRVTRIDVADVLRID